MKFFSIVLIGCILTLANSLSAEESGRELAENKCQVCHGGDGRSDDPSIPSIGGFSRVAIHDLTAAYRHDYRPASNVVLPDGTESNMQQVVEALSDEELAQISSYYASLTWAPHTQTFDRDLAERGFTVHKVKCNKCHLKEGSIPESDLAILSGQWRDYLEKQFRDFENGSRRMSPKMEKKFSSLSAEDKIALIELYVSGGNYRE